MDVVVDTSALIAVITNAPERNRILVLSDDAEVFACESVHWEIGNAFSAMLRRGRVTVEVARQAIEAYERIELRRVDVPLARAVELAHALRIYADDAYVIAAALAIGAPLITLDQGLGRAARRAGVEILEVA